MNFAKLIIVFVLIVSVGCVSQPRSRSGPQLLLPISSTRPKVPDLACQQHLDGEVTLTFTVTASGLVEDVLVATSEPAGVFDSASVELVQGWRYASRPSPVRVRQLINWSDADCRPDQFSVPTNFVAISGTASTYLLQAENIIAAAIHYPTQAARKGEEGRVDLQVVILRDGTITDSRILHPSRSALLNDEALAALGRVKLRPVPDDMSPQSQTLRLDLPVNFRLEGDDTQPPAEILSSFASLPADFIEDNPPGHQQRTLLSVQRAFDRSKAEFYAHYQAAQQRRGHIDGRVNIAIAIEPSGTVKAVTLIDSTVADTPLEEAIIETVKKMDFGRAAGDGLYLTSYPISFLK